ncbi:hypothetical protein ON010_g15465 [Phytophthora cinnamomi]|nr:hypothetical protein ON010_g15465 [Phytophthora cinnamomi]
MEAIMDAAQVKNTQLLNKLLLRFGYTLRDAGKFIAGNGNAEAVENLLTMISDPDKSEDMESETFDVLNAMVTSAACNGHVEVVRLVLPEFDGTDPSCEAAWRVLDIAADKGYLDIVECARDITHHGYYEPEDISSDALFLAIRGRYTAVVNSLLPEFRHIWDLGNAQEQAVATG